MTIVPIDPRMQKPVRLWPTFQTLKVFQCIVSNIFLERATAKIPKTVLFNAPLRIWNCIQVYKKDRRTTQDFENIAFDVVSVAALYFSNGRKVAIVLDVVSELRRLQLLRKAKRKSPFEFRPPLDCTIYENAIKCMSLTEEEARDREVLDHLYLVTCRQMRKDIDKAREINSPFLYNLEKMLYEKETAYRTIVERLHSEV